MTRLFDIFFSTLAIIIISPIMLPIMIALKCTGEHYVFYKQTRIGKNQKEFAVLKFATMLKDSPNLPGGYITQEKDPRILPMGNFLRKTKINELPQLINILVGQMSFVGPRPIVKKHFDLYPDHVKSVICSMTPGLTGIGSLIFRDEEAILSQMPGDRKVNHDSVIAPYKGELELWYNKNRSLRLYFAILLLTAVMVVFPGNALYKKAFQSLPPPPDPLKGYI